MVRALGCARSFRLGLILVTSCAALPAAAQSAKPAPVDPALLMPAAEIASWLEQKDSWGPAYTGGPGWKKFMALIHREIAALAMVDVTDHAFPYTRWYTSEFPDKSGWSFASDGARVEVASYGTQSGSTGPGGVTAAMVLYDLALPVEQRPPVSALAGKIVVVKQQPYDSFATRQRVELGVPTPTAPASYCGNPPQCTPPQRNAEPPSPQWAKTGPLAGYMDYEYRSDPETFPGALFAKTPTNVETSFRNRDQFGQIREVITNVLVPSGALGAVTVMDLSPLAAAGARIHATPRQFNVPLLMLDRVAGAKVLADATAGKRGTLVLDAHEEENATAFETVATLPGRNYGTPDDQAILLATHVDGPSIVEDDGGLGLLAVLRYYAKIPQAQRSKSLIAFFDTRHFVPGTEGSYPFDLVKDRPELFRSVVGGVAMEHFGGLQFVETGNDYAPSGRPATTYIWGWPNELAIAAATQAIKDQLLPRAVNDVPARPGVNGKPQQSWLGGGFSRYLVDLGGWPGWHVSGDWPSGAFQAFYPAAKARVSADLFRKQAAVATELVGTLMTGDVIALAPGWGYLQTAIATLEDSAFLHIADAAATRARLKQDFDATFALVQAAKYAQVRGALLGLSSDAETALITAASESLKAPLQMAAKLADRGIAWSARPQAGMR